MPDAVVKSRVLAARCFPDASGRFSRRSRAVPLRSRGAGHSGTSGDRPRFCEYDPVVQPRRCQGPPSIPELDTVAGEPSIRAARCSSLRPVDRACGSIDTAAAGLDVGQPSPEHATVLLDNLPGYPDNLTARLLDGRIWLGFTGPRSPKVDAMADKPFLREVTLRLPRMLWPLPKKYGHVFAFTVDGRVVADLQDPSGSYPETHRRHRNSRSSVCAEPAFTCDRRLAPGHNRPSGSFTHFARKRTLLPSSPGRHVNGPCDRGGLASPHTRWP